MAEAAVKHSFARAVVVGTHVHVGPESTPVGKPRPQAKAEPKVEIIREGNLIRAVDIVCTCGETIRLRLDYE
jgi:hypothetical protein